MRLYIVVRQLRKVFIPGYLDDYGSLNAICSMVPLPSSGSLTHLTALSDWLRKSQQGPSPSYRWDSADELKRDISPQLPGQRDEGEGQRVVGRQETTIPTTRAPITSGETALPTTSAAPPTTTSGLPIVTTISIKLDDVATGNVYVVSGYYDGPKAAHSVE